MNKSCQYIVILTFFFLVFGMQGCVAIRSNMGHSDFDYYGLSSADYDLYYEGCQQNKKGNPSAGLKLFLNILQRNPTNVKVLTHTALTYHFMSIQLNADVYPNYKMLREKSAHYALLALKYDPTNVTDLQIVTHYYDRIHDYQNLTKYSHIILDAYPDSRNLSIDEKCLRLSALRYFAFIYGDLKKYEKTLLYFKQIVRETESGPSNKYIQADRDIALDLIPQIEEYLRSQTKVTKKIQQQVIEKQKHRLIAERKLIIKKEISKSPVLVETGPELDKRISRLIEADPELKKEISKLPETVKTDPKLREEVSKRVKADPELKEQEDDLFAFLDVVKKQTEMSLGL